MVVDAHLVLLGGAGTGRERATAAVLAAALAVRRVAIAVGGERVDGRVAAEDNGGGPSRHVVPVLNSVRSFVGLDGYFDGLKFWDTHDCGHQPHLVVSSGDLDHLIVKACLSVLSRHGSVTAPPDSLAAVALGSGAHDGVLAASASPCPLGILTITDAHIPVAL